MEKRPPRNRDPAFAVRPGGMGLSRNTAQCQGRLAEGIRGLKGLGTGLIEMSWEKYWTWSHKSWVWVLIPLFTMCIPFGQRTLSLIRNIQPMSFNNTEKGYW